MDKGRGRGIAASTSCVFTVPSRYPARGRSGRAVVLVLALAEDTDGARANGRSTPNGLGGVTVRGAAGADRAWAYGSPDALRGTVGHGRAGAVDDASAEGLT
ncbi:hypothetical protein DFH06DRAFT_1340558 [Mycena polygramma]|nr:hypothetical protein DFH06DRAFT_1340558 [Mycena polygramma]